MKNSLKIQISSIFLSFLFSAAILLTGCENVNDTVPAFMDMTEEIASETVSHFQTEASVSTVSETTETTTEYIEPEPEFLTVSFAATGDNLIHSSIYNQAQKRSEAAGNPEGYDFAFAYESIVPLIEPADIAVINQETLICNDIFAPSTYPMFNSPTELGDHMLEIGFDVFTIANNHTLDKGTDGLSACLDYWDSRPEAVVCGAYRDETDFSTIRTLEKNGITFSFLSYTESLNGLSLPAGSPMIIGRTQDTDLICEQIRQAKEISDVCVVALHWGVEDSDIISDYQRTVASILAEAGADIIIGNHPHVLRGIEEIERSDGSYTLCAYSLGNFISAQSKGQNLIGGILQFDVSLYVGNDPEVSRNPSFDNIRLVPVVTHYDGNYHDVRLYPLSEYTRELAESHGVKSMSKFGYDYIFEVLERNIDAKYLDLSEYYAEE